MGKKESSRRNSDKIDVIKKFYAEQTKPIEAKMKESGSFIKAKDNNKSYPTKIRKEEI